MTEVLPPLVEAYLADLDRALVSADPRERAETLAAVRDHVTESLQGQAGEDDAVARVLHDLGPVDEIAAAATPGTSTAASPHPRGDGWLLACSIVGLVLFWLPPVALASLIWAIAQLRTRSGDRPRQRAALWISIAALATAAVTATFYLSAGAAPPVPVGTPVAVTSAPVD